MELTLANILVDIIEVTNWRDLGLQLGLSSSKLDIIQASAGSDINEAKAQLITAWLDTDPEASWQKLVKALASRAMCENRASKGIAERRGSSFDAKSALEYQSLESSFSGLCMCITII